MNRETRFKYLAYDFDNEMDIKKDKGKKIEDHYGNLHEIPEKTEIKINIYRNRNIKLIEIK